MDLLQMVQDLVLAPITSAAVQGLHFLPHLGLAALILAVGIPLAILAREVTARLLRALGLDVLSERTGFTRLLERGGVSKRPSRSLGLLSYWVIIFSSLILVFDVLEIPAGARLIQQVLALLPRILEALLITSLGVFLGRLTGRIVRASSLIANVPFAAVLGGATSYAVIAVSLVAGLRLAGFLPDTFTGLLAAAAIVAPAVAAIVVLVGSPRTLSAIVAGRFLREQLKAGDRVSFDGIHGEVRAVQLVATCLREDGEDIIISNADLATRIIRRSPGVRRRSPAAPRRRIARKERRPQSGGPPRRQKDSTPGSSQP